MNIRDGFNLYYANFGIKGPIAITSYRLLRFASKITARCPGILHPVEIRIGTTDASLYRSVLRSEEYGFNLPFSPKTIVDAGANIGMASIYFANKYPEARIAAVEAEHSNFSIQSQLEKTSCSAPFDVNFQDVD